MTTRYPRKPIRRWTPSYDVAPTAISNRLGNAIWDVLMTGKTTVESGGIVADIDYTTPPVDKAANRPIGAELDEVRSYVRVLQDKLDELTPEPLDQDRQGTGRSGALIAAVLPHIVAEIDEAEAQTKPPIAFDFLRRKT